MSDSDEHFRAVRSPGEQLVVHRERISALRVDVNEVEKSVGKILGEMSDLRQGFALLNQKLDPILAQYWHEHPSKAHTPSSAPPRKSAISGLVQSPVTQLGAVFLALQIIAELVRALIGTPSISIPKVQSPAPTTVAPAAPAAK